MGLFLVLVLPFLDCSDFTKENPKFTKDFPSLLNPVKPWKKGKHPNGQGNSLLKMYQGNSKNQGQEGQGWAVFQAIFKRKNGPLTHWGIQPMKGGKRPIKEGNAPLRPMGCVRAPCKGGKRPL